MNDSQHTYGRPTRVLIGVLVTILIAGCGDAESEQSKDATAASAGAAAPVAHTHANPDETCFICDASLRDKGRLWCKEHGRYEDRCWLCHPELEDKDRLYCAEHFLYEDECHLCHPDLKEKEDAAASEANASGDGAAKEVCTAHSLDASLCFICDASLRDKGRLWCKEHGRYEDRCWLCHPELEEKDRDYCEEHFLYEDECLLCNPALRKEGSDKAAASPHAKPGGGIFCNEHGVYEAECAICQPGLATSLAPGQSMKIRFASARSTAKAGVVTSKPALSESAPTINAYCEVRYNANAMARITPQAPGVVRSIGVDVGERVRKGQVLAELDSPELAGAKSAYIAKVQAVELAKIDLDRSKLIHENTQKALDLCKGELSLGELEALSGLDLGLNRRDLLSAHAALGAARAAYHREKELLDQEVGSRAEFQAAEAEYRSALAEFMAVRDDLAFGSHRDLEAKTRAFKATEFERESAKRQLLTLGLSAEQVAQVPDEPTEELAVQRARAPFDGTIIDRVTAVGEAVEPGDPILSMANLNKMWLVLSIPADQAAHVRPGMRVTAKLPDLPSGEVGGEIAWVDSSINERSRMVSARAVIENPDGVLRAGMFGQARIVLGKTTKAVRVPRDAVQRYEKEPYVFVKLEDDLYALRRVEVGTSVDGAVDILSGLRPEESVVTIGSFTMLSEFLKSRLGAGCVDD